MTGRGFGVVGGGPRSDPASLRCRGGRSGVGCGFTSVSRAAGGGAARGTARGACGAGGGSPGPGRVRVGCRGGRSAAGSGFPPVWRGAVRGRIRLHYGVAAGPAAAGAASFRSRDESGPLPVSRGGGAVRKFGRAPSYPLRRFGPSLPAPLRPPGRARWG